MSTIKNSIGPVAILLMLFLLLPMATLAGNKEEKRPGVGSLAPSFTAADLDGRMVSLEETVKSGKVVLLNFWGLRCGSCIEEIGYLNLLHDQFRDKGVVFWGVNVDGAKADTIRRLMPKMPAYPKYPVIVDPELKIPDLYNMFAAPLSFVIGRDGKIAYRHDDFKPGDEKGLEGAIRNAISANP